MKQGSVCRAWKSCVGKGRRRLYQKALAVSLSVATAVSCLPANMASVSAATKPYVSMRTTFKTLQVGQKNRMTLKNNTAGWKIQKISTNDETIAAVSAKTEKSFQIQGKGVGRTTVKAVLKTTSRKKHTSKTVRCRVKVVAAEDTEPKPEQQTPVTETEVSTQEQLEQALTNVSLKKLTIAASNAAKFVIPAGSYPNVSLIVNAPLSDVENNGVFQSIEIHAVKPDTWFECNNSKPRNGWPAVFDNERSDGLREKQAITKAISKKRCEYERKSTDFWKISKRHGNAEYRRFHCVGADCGVVY